MRDWRDLSWREYTPKGLFENCDLFVAEPRNGVFLLIDGAPGTGTCQVPRPRSHLFHLVSRVWPELIDPAASPTKALTRLGEALRQSNREHSGQKMWCSAAICRLTSDPGGWAIAEAGDTKILRLTRHGAAPIFTEGLPVEGRSVPGALGTESAVIRSQTLSLADGEKLVLLTDGAYHLLSEASAIRADGSVSAAVDLLQTFEDHAYDGKDDATLVII